MKNKFVILTLSLAVFLVIAKHLKEKSTSVTAETAVLPDVEELKSSQPQSHVPEPNKGPEARTQSSTSASTFTSQEASASVSESAPLEAPPKDIRKIDPEKKAAALKTLSVFN